MLFTTTTPDGQRMFYDMPDERQARQVVRKAVTRTGIYWKFGLFAADGRMLGLTSIPAKSA